MPAFRANGIAADSDNTAAFTTCNLPSGDGCLSTPWNGSLSLERPGPGVGPLPTLVLIGTRKGGTTGFTTQLLKHPHLLAPDCRTDRASWPRGAASLMCVWDKEVRYFSRGGRGGVDLCWYRKRYPCVPPGAPHVAVDASPDYLVIGAEKVAIMARTLPAPTKLLALLRNPADRFYSAYNMGMNEHVQRAGRGRGGFLGRLRNRRELQASRGAVDGGLARGRGRGGRGRNLQMQSGGGASELSYATFAGSLDRYLACAPECAEEPGVVSMFFDYGLYAKHLRHFIEHFGKGRLLVQKSEDFYADAWATVREAAEFAGLAITAEFEASVRAGEGGAKDAAAAAPAAGLAAAAITGRGPTDGRNSGAMWGGKGYTGKLQPAERKKLQGWYAPYNKELYTLIGRDFGWEAEVVEA